MICVIALIVFGIIGVFSASHRGYAKEAFDCVFRRVTLRKCNTGFNQKMKMKISTGLLKKNKRVGNFVFKRFDLQVHISVHVPPYFVGLKSFRKAVLIEFSQFFIQSGYMDFPFPSVCDRYEM